MVVIEIATINIFIHLNMLVYMTLNLQTSQIMKQLV